MPDLLDRIYCSEQIHIPPTFPYIMKLYCKAAIRTQPYDLLKWSAAYFRALASGEDPPTKERIEYPPYDSPSGLTPGYIKILIHQFGKDPDTTVTAQMLFKKWTDVCLQEHLLIRLIALLGASTTINWVKFVGVCAGYISKTLTQTMILICELFTEEPEGGMATVPFSLFIDLYIFLAQMECGPLTEEEQKALDAIMVEEDICEVSDKIKRGIYEGEYEGEFEYPEERGESIIELGTEEEKMALGEEESFGKELNISLEGEASSEKVDEKNEEKDEVYDTYSSEPSLTQSAKEVESAKSVLSDEEETQLEMQPEDTLKIGDEEEKTEEVDLEIPSEKEEKPLKRKINLEDMEESIRAKIESKLAEDKESVEEEHEGEFEELSSYLLGAAARVQKYTAEELGFRIFKKYLRQDVPGIGPAIEGEQVEKVVDFMDFWSHKQEEMIMPRNIRHWMCPPLDKVPPMEP